MILRDNVYGSVEDDAWRRDFTVNALYYNVRDFSVVDYTGGLQDLREGVLRLIGDPEQRLREDPVRMLRAVRFAAKLGFRLDPELEAQLQALGELLTAVPSARLFDEMLKLFQGGFALETYELLRHYRLFGFLFPWTEASLAEEAERYPRTLLPRALANTDARIAEGKAVTPAFLFAALLWEPVRQEATRLMEEGMGELQAWQLAGQEVVNRQVSRIAFPKRFSIQSREIWTLQTRLDNPRFRAAYDFLLLRNEAGEALQELCEWWTAFQADDQEARASMLSALGGGPKKRRRRRKRPAAQ